MFLTRLVYHTLAGFDTGTRSVSEEMGRILTAGLRNNPPQGLTGVLAVDGNRFLQVLEGSRLAVSSTFRRIAADTSHRGLEIVFCGEVDARCFEDWAVAVLREDTFPPCEGREVVYDHITAEGLVERARRIRETGLIARRETLNVDTA